MDGSEAKTIVRTAVAVASRRCGVISAAELRRVGFSGEQIRRRWEEGWLVRLHRGVYALGGRELTERMRMHAALLACGSGCVLSHGSAARAWELVPSMEGSVHVSAVGRNIRSRPGIVVHRLRDLPPVDRRRYRGLDLVSPSRALLDLAATESASTVEAALNEALLHRRTDREQLGSVLARHRGQAGTALLGRLFDVQDGSGFTRSWAERELGRIIIESKLPGPERNAEVEGVELDFFWPELRLNIEMDGYRWHSTRSRLLRDRERDAILISSGITVLRVSYEQLKRPQPLIARIAATMALAGSARSTGRTMEG